MTLFLRSDPYFRPAQSQKWGDDPIRLLEKGVFQGPPRLGISAPGQTRWITGYSALLAVLEHSRTLAISRKGASSILL